MENKLTFGDLDRIIDRWATELQDYQGVFINQLAETNSIFWRIGSNDEKINAISCNLSILHYMHLQLDKQLERADQLHQIVEHQITKLEKIVQYLDEKSPVDIARERMYGITQNINCLLNHYANETQTLAIENKRNEAASKKDPVEQIAKIMTKLLEKLEAIEANMEHIKNRIHWIDYMKNSISHIKNTN